MEIKVKILDDLVLTFGGDSLWSGIKEQKDIRIIGMELFFFMTRLLTDFSLNGLAYTLVPNIIQTRIMIDF